MVYKNVKEFGPICGLCLSGFVGHLHDNPWTGNPRTLNKKDIDTGPKKYTGDRIVKSFDYKVNQVKADEDIQPS
jgi:hypothetical protein